MKKRFQYLAAFLVLLVVGTSCKDNDNWTIVNAPQPGVYISGTATVFSANAQASSLKSVKPDGSDASPDLLGIYTWLKKEGTFVIVEADESGNPVQYGQGSVLEQNAVIQRSSLVPEANPFSVSEEGLYYVVVNTALAQLSLFPVHWGLIGDATIKGWDGETLFTSIRYNEKGSYVDYTVTTPLKSGSYKFRFSGNWGYHIPLTDTETVNLYTDVTGGAKGDDNALTDGFTDLQNGGDNLVNKVAGEYEVVLRFDIRAGKFSAKDKMVGPLPE